MDASSVTLSVLVEVVELVLAHLLPALAIFLNKCQMSPMMKGFATPTLLVAAAVVVAVAVEEDAA